MKKEKRFFQFVSGHGFLSLHPRMPYCIRAYHACCALSPTRYEWLAFWLLFGVSPRPVSATNPNPKRRAFSAGVVSCKMFFQHSRVHCLCKQVIHAYLQPLKLNLNLPFVRNEDARSLFCSGSFIQGESSQGQCMEPWDVSFYFFSRKSNGNHPTNLLRVRNKITYIMLLRVRLPR